jgi:hypothetical protein
MLLVDGVFARAFRNAEKSIVRIDLMKHLRKGISFDYNGLRLEGD